MTYLPAPNMSHINIIEQHVGICWASAVEMCCYSMDYMLLKQGSITVLKYLIN